eukprot:6377-Heterococcus_DN1.PRE.4
MPRDAGETSASAPVMVQHEATSSSGSLTFILHSKLQGQILAVNKEERRKYKTAKLRPLDVTCNCEQQSRNLSSFTIGSVVVYCALLLKHQSRNNKS